MLVIYAKLSIDGNHRAWIDSVRRAHDPQHALVEPHMTLVFPFTGPGAAQVAAHVGPIAQRTPAVAFRLARTEVVREGTGPRAYVFLVPTEGFGELRGLYGALHTGVLAPVRHPEMDFLPHVTVGILASTEAAARVTASLGSVDIKGVIRGLELAALDGDMLTDLQSFPLA